jgi:hypothetical protein
MDKPNHPNVIRTWAVDRTRSRHPAPVAARQTGKRKDSTRPRPPGPGRKKP